MKCTAVLPVLMMSMLLSGIGASAGTWSDGFQTEASLDSWVLARRWGKTIMEVRDGGLHFEAHARIISDYQVIGSDDWEDYTVSVRVKLLEIIDDFAVGGLFIRGKEAGVVDKNDNSWYAFFLADRWIEVQFPGVPLGGRGMFVSPRVEGQGELEGLALEFEPRLNRWYHVTAIADGDHTEFYLDDKLVGEFDHKELNFGAVGLLVANASVQFDDFVVTGRQIRDGGPGGAKLSVSPKGSLVASWAALKGQRW
jgi:hypothetical protein